MTKDQLKQAHDAQQQLEAIAQHRIGLRKFLEENANVDGENTVIDLEPMFDDSGITAPPIQLTVGRWLRLLDIFEAESAATLKRLGVS